MGLNSLTCPPSMRVYRPPLTSFSGEPETIWDGARNMRLLKEISYTDPDGRVWTVPVTPKKAFLNGATIPRPLWTAIGSPYAGKYRRASVIHDFHVGEGDNDDVSDEHRKAADKMFYHACRYDGCSRRFAALLYIGVRFGSIISTWDDQYQQAAFGDDEDVRKSPEYDYILAKYWEIVDEAGSAVEDGELEKLDEIIDRKMRLE